MSRVDLGAMDKLQQFARIGPAERELIAMATAELRAARELLACATEFEVAQCTLIKSEEGWFVYVDMAIRNHYPTLAEALAAAREWEKGQS